VDSLEVGLLAYNSIGVNLVNLPGLPGFAKGILRFDVEKGGEVKQIRYLIKSIEGQSYFVKKI